MSQFAIAPASESFCEVIKSVVFDQSTVERRVKEIAAQVSLDYQGRELIVIGILKGAHIFTSDLVRYITIPVVMDFVSISRYKRAPGEKEVKITHDLEAEIHGKDILIVEDIIDTGLTLHYLAGILKEREPKSVAICSLLDRPALRLAEIPMKYVGFNVNEEQFLIGYGLDYRDQYRELPFIAEMNIWKEPTL
jgi:hypoxanthine phosphoribosyltransferase